MPAAQFKALWDATGGLWQKGALAGKAVGVFFSTASQGGGQETTAFTCEPAACMNGFGSPCHQSFSPTAAMEGRVLAVSTSVSCTLAADLGACAPVQPSRSSRTTA